MQGLFSHRIMCLVIFQAIIMIDLIIRLLKLNLNFFHEYIFCLRLYIIIGITSHHDPRLPDIRRIV